MSYTFHAGLRAALMGSVAAVAIAAPAHAQDARSFDIPAQAATTAVPSFAQQSDLQILATAADLQGVRTNAVQGTMAPDAALDALIRGTGLTVRSRDGRSVVLARLATASPPPTPPPHLPQPRPPTISRPRRWSWSACESRCARRWTSSATRPASWKPCRQRTSAPCLT